MLMAVGHMCIAVEGGGGGRGAEEDIEVAGKVGVKGMYNWQALIWTVRGIHTIIWTLCYRDSNIGGCLMLTSNLKK